MQTESPTTHPATFHFNCSSRVLTACGSQQQPERGPRGRRSRTPLTPPPSPLGSPAAAIRHVPACRSHVAEAAGGGATPRRASRGPRHELLGPDSSSLRPRAQPGPRALAYRAASALPARGKGTTGFPGCTSRASSLASFLTFFKVLVLLISVWVSDHSEFIRN